MIDFRCWYCNRRYAVPEKRIGQQIACTCQRRLRVPRRSGGSSRVRSLADWCVEILVYGGGGGLLGFFVAIATVPRISVRSENWILIAGLTVAGFLVGALGGERGINWIGRRLRGWEER